MSRRKKTPRNTETEVLISSARRCCMCFGLQFDLSTKKGQIAHLDGDPSNSDIDNLAFLCMPHHDDYDGKTQQSKGFTISEVKKYRTLLYQAVRQSREDKPAAIVPNTNFKSARRSDDPLTTQIHDLLTKVQSRVAPLSQCLAEGLALARTVGNNSFEEFCRKELSGYMNDSNPPTYRVITMFISGTARINPQSPLWGGDLRYAIDQMRRDTENFLEKKFLISHAVSMMESTIRDADVKKGLLVLNFRLGDLDPNAKDRDRPLWAYAMPSDYQSILEDIRRELTVYLLNALPPE